MNTENCGLCAPSNQHQESRIQNLERGTGRVQSYRSFRMHRRTLLTTNGRAAFGFAVEGAPPDARRHAPRRAGRFAGRGCRQIAPVGSPRHPEY